MPFLVSGSVRNLWFRSLSRARGRRFRLTTSTPVGSGFLGECKTASWVFGRPLHSSPRRCGSKRRLLRRGSRACPISLARAVRTTPRFFVRSRGLQPARTRGPSIPTVPCHQVGRAPRSCEARVGMDRESVLGFGAIRPHPLPTVCSYTQGDSRPPPLKRVGHPVTAQEQWHTCQGWGDGWVSMGSSPRPAPWAIDLPLRPDSCPNHGMLNTYPAESRCHTEVRRFSTGCYG